jgi:hypothetical protein
VSDPALIFPVWQISELFSEMGLYALPDRQKSPRTAHWMPEIISQKLWNNDFPNFGTNKKIVKNHDVILK